MMQQQQVAAHCRSCRRKCTATKHWMMCCSWLTAVETPYQSWQTSCAKFVDLKRTTELLYVIWVFCSKGHCACLTSNVAWCCFRMFAAMHLWIVILCNYDFICNSIVLFSEKQRRISGDQVLVEDASVLDGLQIWMQVPLTKVSIHF